MVEIKAPVKLKDLEGKLGVLFNSLVAGVSKRELLGTQKMVAINLKKEESIVLLIELITCGSCPKIRKGTML